jgi:hypothetical protein
MNLSSRLEAARRQREQATASPPDGATLDLRSTANSTGNRGQGLPTWRPDPVASPSFDQAPPIVDLTRRDTSAPLPAPAPAPDSFAADVIELPSWAQERPTLSPAPAPVPDTPVDPNACTNCGGESRVDVLDLLGGIAHLECTKCGLKWQAPTARRTGPGRY